MGRKTYESLPKHLRPLRKRINVVVSRDAGGSVAGSVKRDLEVREEMEKAKRKENSAASAAAVQEEPVTDGFVSSGLEDALEVLDRVYTVREDKSGSGRLGNIFIIGGGEIYASSLRLGAQWGRNLRIVMTVVRNRAADERPETDSNADVLYGRAGDSAFECDTFFPLHSHELTPEHGWRQASADEVSEWVGEGIISEWKAENNVSIRVVGFERL